MELRTRGTRFEIWGWTQLFKYILYLQWFLLFVILCVAASPSVCLLCLRQHHEAPNGTAFGLWGERQTHEGAEEDPWTHRNNRSPSQRTVWAPVQLTFWWPEVHVWQGLGLTLSPNAVLRPEQTKASAAGVGAELCGGPEGRGWQRAGWAQPADDPGPTWRVQSQPGGTFPWVAPPAGAQRSWWVCLVFNLDLSRKCTLWSLSVTFSHHPVCLGASAEQKLSFQDHRHLNSVWDTC